MKIENQSTASQGSIFEHQVSQMFAGLGIFENITVTQRSNDGGIDILMEGITPIGDIIKCGVECKDLDVVGRPIIQKLHSAIQMNIKHNGIKYGYVVTSGRFTLDAIDYANIINAEHVNLKIYLINGRELRKLEYLNRNFDSEFSINREDSKGFDSFRNYKYGKIRSQFSGKSQISKKITKAGRWGSIESHLVIFVFTFWTYGICNLLYALYVHYDLKSKLQTHIDNAWHDFKSKLQTYMDNVHYYLKSKLQTHTGNVCYYFKSKLQTNFYNLYVKKEKSEIYYTSEDSTTSMNEKREEEKGEEEKGEDEQAQDPKANPVYQPTAKEWERIETEEEFYKFLHRQLVHQFYPTIATDPDWSKKTEISKQINIYYKDRDLEGLKNIARTYAPEWVQYFKF